MVDDWTHGQSKDDSERNSQSAVFGLADDKSFGQVRTVCRHSSRSMASTRPLIDNLHARSLPSFLQLKREIQEIDCRSSSSSSPHQAQGDVL